MGALRGIVLQLSAALHYRVDAYVNTYPFRLIDMVHPEKSEEDRFQAAVDLYAAPRCCLDHGFSLKLRGLFPDPGGPQKLLDSDAAMGALRAWMNRGKATVAHVERMRAANKYSFKSSEQHRRHAE
eukprot:5345650-Pyramimonas_sp.AAC.1